jgi:hypothetical protein
METSLASSTNKRNVSAMALYKNNKQLLVYVIVGTVLWLVLTYLFLRKSRNFRVYWFAAYVASTAACAVLYYQMCIT